ncbi:cation:dicarboxylate symporter family transporter [Novipirellula artificiosorum]|uniref:cation:dicarboxylate symporter family transporter n=1 Tax=Novipirellula artificiosorum TaxID=2528016 RepID=UPI0018CCF971|nr:cation:dicarboxylase symporter family transporter [Novipirellula artificiosorum]
MDERTSRQTKLSHKPRKGHGIALALVLGGVCGILFGEGCEILKPIGDAYIGLLQMTVLPYLVLSLISKTARLDAVRASKLAVAAIGVLLGFWLIAMVLIVLVSAMLPPVEGASFYSPEQDAAQQSFDFNTTFIPTNVFRAISNEYVPAIVVFCLFLGIALMRVPGKEKLVDLMEILNAGIGRINSFLVRLAPLGLFALSAAASGTIRLDEFSRLQAYLILFTLACVIAAFAALPLLLSGISDIPYRKVLRAAEEPMLTAIAVGKLFVVLPQIAEKCEQLLAEQMKTSEMDASEDGSTASVMVPLAYPFPHIGKILSCIFVSFAAWYVGRDLSLGQTAMMAAAGTVSGFASPLVTIPALLQMFELPQDLMALFILPGFITTRLADVVGVMHLMTLTIIVTLIVSRRIHVRWGRLGASALAIMLCLGMAGFASRLYLKTTAVEYDLDKRLLALEISSDFEDFTVYRMGDTIPSRPGGHQSTLERIRSEKVLRVGYHPEHMPYSFFNSDGELVGMDIELVYQLAEWLKVRLEFVPCNRQSVIERLEAGDVDLVVGGLMMTPERLLRVGFTKPYQSVTLSIVLPDHQSHGFQDWNAPHREKTLRLGAIHVNIAEEARLRLDHVQTTVLDSIASYFRGEHPDLDGLILGVDEAIAWNVLYPDHAVVVPKPVIRRPVGMAVRSSDTEWLRLLDRWLDFETHDGAVERLNTYWVKGGGTETRPPRWCVMRDLLGWIE